MKLEILFLKIVVVLIGIAILALWIFGLPWLANNPVNPDYAHILYPVLIGMYVSMIPFSIALYKAFRLLSYIDMNKAFSELSVNALKNIKYCAITIGTLYLVMLPFVFLVADKDDAPGLVLFGMVFPFVSIVIAAFASILQKLFKNAMGK